MNTPLTMAELEAALASGDDVCVCGYRESQHENHPAPNPHTGKCGADGFKRSTGLAEAVLDEKWVREQEQLKAARAKANKAARDAKASAA